MCLHGAAFAIPFNLQHGHVLKKLKFDLSVGSEGKIFATILLLRAKYLLPYRCIRDSIKFDMQHDRVLNKV